jgi:flagellar biosynthesis/type III secretory pathway M-ring protein FliF/YscJ
LRTLSVDVLINNPSRNPISAERIRSITKLVNSAIGAGENRHVTVVDLPFADQASSTGEANPPWWRQAWMSAIEQNAVLVAAGLLLLFGGLLPLLRHARLSLAAIGAERGELAAGREGPEGRAEPMLGSLVRPVVVDAETVRALAANDPVRTAQVIKEWIARDRTGIKRAS